ncbi:unnamed protein product [Psylliodes chrysocephalus]|uniref:Transposase n=1 Tax=Psylliodes chrysocephalus TaxID=3402493 RepID=A0A9P0CY31_9CUCU|nr:unnamed protein product [Psylliodes chrysocephala]
MYLELLENAIYPALLELIKNDDQYMANNLIFQQDGAPSHFALTVHQYLDQTFSGQWIGRRESIEWPPRSSDLTLSDF